VLSFDLSGKGGPTSSYATAGIALWIIAPLKPPYPAKDVFVKVETLQGGSKQIILRSFIDVMHSGKNAITSRRNCCAFTEYGEADDFSGTSVNVYRSTGLQCITAQTTLFTVTTL